MDEPTPPQEVKVFTKEELARIRRYQILTLWLLIAGAWKSVEVVGFLIGKIFR